MIYDYIIQPVVEHSHACICVCCRRIVHITTIEYEVLLTPYRNNILHLKYGTNI